MPVLDIPQDVYDAASKAAQRKGQTVPEWIADLAEESAPTKRQPTQEEIDASNRRLEACIVHGTPAYGTENEQIDAELAAYYSSEMNGG